MTWPSDCRLFVPGSIRAFLPGDTLEYGLTALNLGAPMPLTALKRFPLFRLLLAAAVGYAWWRSHSKTDVLALFLLDGKANLLASDRGRAVYIWTNISLGPRRAFTYDALHGSNEKFSDQRQTFYETPPVPERVAAVWLGSGTGVMGMPDSRYRMISVPFWEL